MLDNTFHDTEEVTSAEVTDDATLMFRCCFFRSKYLVHVRSSLLVVVVVVVSVGSVEGDVFLRREDELKEREFGWEST